MVNAKGVIVSLALAVCGVGCGGSSGEPGNTDPVGKDPVRCLAAESEFLTYFATGSQYSDDFSLSSLTFGYPGDALSMSFGDALRVTGTVADYSGVGISFQACVDASAYSGIEFDIGGNVGPTRSLTVYADTRANAPEPPFTEIGTCVPADPAQPYRSCSDAYVSLPVEAGVFHARVPFASFAGGMPDPSVDPSMLLSFFFAFDWNASQAPYPLDVTLGDVSFSPK